MRNHSNLTERRLVTVIIFADVHGHGDSLRAVKELLEPDEDALFLGDAIGDGDANEICVREIDEFAEAVVGNHDRHSGGLSEKSQSIIEEWPIISTDESITCFHGTPEFTGRRVRKASHRAEIASKLSTNLIASGHSHRPSWWTGPSPNSLNQRDFEYGVSYDLNPNHIHWLNPGSPSEPRQKDNTPTVIRLTENQITWVPLEVEPKRRTLGM